jgi:broad specificity phosphatase PhoE
MRNYWFFIIWLASLHISYGQEQAGGKIVYFQKDNFEDGECLDFVRDGDIEGVWEKDLQQIIIIRHGEPAMNKGGWKNREEVIRYSEMYDSVGVYDFQEKPICLRNDDLEVIYTSRLPRAINTAEKTFGSELLMEQMAIFNEFDNNVIKLPNIKLPRKFWSVTNRIVWIAGMNDDGIESFSDARERAEEGAAFLDSKAREGGKVVLFAHGFLNKYLQMYLKRAGYRSVNLNGTKYLGAYYLCKIKE